MTEKPKLSYLELMDNYTDLKILNGQLSRENKEYKALLETADAMLTQLREERKEFVPIIEMGINTANILLSHSKKSRKLELHNLIEDLIDETMESFKGSLEYYKEKWEGEQ